MNKPAPIEVTLRPTDEMFTTMNQIVDRAQQAVDIAQTVIEMAQQVNGDTSVIYETLSRELDSLREEMRARLHDLGNNINGKLGAYEAEVFIRQIVQEELKSFRNE